MCDCAEEQERREREAAEAAAKLKAEEAARAAEEAAAAQAARAQQAARAAAARNPPDSWFTWFLKLFGFGKPQARKSAGSTSRGPPPRRGPFYWMAVLLGTFAVYFGLASLYCSIINDLPGWKRSLSNARDFMLDPCAHVTCIRRNFNDLYVFLTCHLCQVYGYIVEQLSPITEQMAICFCQLVRALGRLFSCLQGLVCYVCGAQGPPKKSCRPKPPCGADPCGNKK